MVQFATDHDSESQLNTYNRREWGELIRGDNNNKISADRKLSELIYMQSVFILFICDYFFWFWVVSFLRLLSVSVSREHCGNECGEQLWSKQMASLTGQIRHSKMLNQIVLCTMYHIQLLVTFNCPKMMWSQNINWKLK